MTLLQEFFKRRDFKTAIAAINNGQISEKKQTIKKNAHKKIVTQLVKGKKQFTLHYLGVDVREYWSYETYEMVSDTAYELIKTGKYPNTFGK